MAVSKRLRYEILRRDNNTCRYCGGKAPDVALTIDHVTPVALGGGDDPSNLVAACKDCNAGKSSVPAGSDLIADVQAKAVRWAQAIHLYNESQAAHRKDRDRYVKRFDKAWLEWHCGLDKEPVPRDAGWLTTIWRFHDSGLPIDELLDAVQIAGGNSMVTAQRTWVYFCGVAWRRVKAMQEGARDLLDDDTDDQDEEDDYPTADYQQGWSEAYDFFALDDIPHRMIANVVEGSNRRYANPFRWVA